MLKQEEERRNRRTTTDIQNSDLFNNPELFEIEIEVIDYNDSNLFKSIKSTVKLILSDVFFDPDVK